ncbi:hypothetical protein [Lactococcus sp.]|uniref:hypothetical protein n=1 Tax=Lactococcus sp. TaxID=44273 RepID=UPI002FC81904
MKKITLLTTTILALGSIGITTGAQLAQADVVSPNTTIQSTTSETPSPRIVVGDKGTFEQIMLDQYDYELNHMGVGFETGNMVIDYKSKSLFDWGFETDKHFNLKLPKEFNAIASMSNGETLKSFIKASYKQPGHNEYTEISRENINTEYVGQIDFKLPATTIIHLGDETDIKIEIQFGKILDSLNRPSDFDYKKIIPDSKTGGYNFEGLVADGEWLELWPGDAAKGISDGDEAVKANDNGTVPFK